MKVSRELYASLPLPAVSRLIGDRFFASPGFASVWRARGGRSVAWIAEDAGRIAAIVPGVEFGPPALCRFSSMPDGCYGGVFVAPEAAAERPRLARALLDAIVRRGYLKTFLHDFYGTIGEAPGFERRRQETTLVDLDGADWQPPDRKLVAQVRKAEREGVRVEPFDWGRHGTRFLRLEERCEGRHGRPPKYPPAFFAALSALAEDDARVRWLWCERDGRAATSHIYFLEGGVLQAWQTYFDRAFSFLKPNQYLRYSLCRELARGGITRVNLGATPPGATGLAYYKHRWGGRPFAYDVFVRRVGVGRWW